MMDVEKTVIEQVEFDEDTELVVAHVRPTKRQRDRCGVCRRPSPGYHPWGGSAPVAGPGPGHGARGS